MMSYWRFLSRFSVTLFLYASGTWDEQSWAEKQLLVRVAPSYVLFGHYVQDFSYY